ncbi:ATP-binding protein [Tumidithrix elongata RA019]|uniref:Circadian input-output histidine kinase CikA n=1 Tax=Tumidithrix elongata BACA0141 TaxID=2716417 RepID=A0AAW9PZB3_9CYAN|nr:ATP-binding protein [Tumidithrix elongata RA019]
MKRFPYPIRFSIPAILVLCGSLFGIGFFSQETNRNFQKTEENAGHYVRITGSQTAGILDYLYRRADVEQAEIVISQLGGDPNLDLVLLLDDRDRVLMSNRYELRDRTANETVAMTYIQKFVGVRERMAGDVGISQDKQKLIAIYPVLLQALPGEIRPSRVGVLFIMYDLAHAKQEAYNNSLYGSLVFGGALLAFCLGLWYFFHRTLTKRVSRLVSASHSLAAGQLDVRTGLTGSDELALVSDAFDRMAVQLKNSFEGLERRVDERTAELKEAKELADSANNAKSEFLASMSHELRTPLNGILGYSQILLRTSQTEQQQRGLEVIYHCGSHLLTLINDVLDIAKIEARKMELNLNPCHLPSLLQGVVEICKIRAEQKNVELLYKSHQSLPKGIITDEKRLRQVLLNLMGNAIKFTDKGKVTFSVEVNDSHEGSSSNQSESFAKILFQIKDTGVGIKPDELEVIFLPFEQVGSSQHKTEGTGLGLAISQKIVEMMGSSIQVSSEFGSGSVFKFELACSLANDWAKAKTLTNSGKIIGYSGRQQKILVVDDSWENRSVFVSLLEPLGFQLVEATNGAEGLIKAHDENPDLIITDLKMPVMDGWQFLSELRQTDLLQDSVVIVTSASVISHEQKPTLEEGSKDFLLKPINAEELYHAIAKHLEIDWIYEKPDAKSLKVESQVVEAVMAIPPASDLQVLLNYAMQGKIDSVQQELEMLAQKNLSYHSFVAHIKLLVGSFKIGQVRQELQEAIRQSQSLNLDRDD